MNEPAALHAHGSDAAARNERIAQIVHFFENLAPADLAHLDAWYAPQAAFKDPFHAVAGVRAISAVYAQMFARLHEPRFVVTRRVVQGPQCFLVWEFRFRFSSASPGKVQTDEPNQVIHGASHLELAPDGRIAMHRDYWDAAEELYEKIPLLGSLMRWLKRRAGA